MVYRLLADLVLLTHLGFVAFVVLGGLLVWRWPRWAWFHVPAALWGAWVEYAGATCPLTPLEIAWRRESGEAGYSGGFIEHYVTAILYPAELTRGAQFLLGTLVVVVNAAVYSRWLVRRGRRR